MSPTVNQPPPDRDAPTAAIPQDDSVVAVIVGYNTRHLLGGCLDSLRRVHHRPFRAIYVDNASTDGSLDFVRTEFPEVEAIAAEGNIGYCGGNNIGIARALECGASSVLILNADTVTCNPDFVGTLAAYLRDHPRVAKVGPKVWLRQKGETQNTILGWPSVLGSALSILGLAPSSPLTKSALATVPVAVPSLNGCCLLVRADALRDVGLYDARFWGYVDEVDWDWQAERNGWERHYVPIESILHFQGAGPYDFTSLANHYIKRNTAIWYAKTGRPVSMFAWMAITMTIALARTITAPFYGHSPKQYASFAGKLATSYRDVFSDWMAGRFRAYPHAIRPGAGTMT